MKTVLNVLLVICFYFYLCLAVSKVGFYFWTFQYEWCFGLCWREKENTSYYNTTLPYYWYWWICLFQPNFLCIMFSYVPTQDGTVYLLNKITKHKLFNDSLKMWNKNKKKQKFPFNITAMENFHNKIWNKIKSIF